MKVIQEGSVDPLLIIVRHCAWHEITQRATNLIIFLPSMESGPVLDSMTKFNRHHA